MEKILINQSASYIGKEVRICGWLGNSRSSGKIHFLQIRDGSGEIQGIIDEGQVPKDTSKAAKTVSLESSLEAVGTIKQEKRSPSGYDFVINSLRIIQQAEDYPIGNKEHGADFLLDHRHLWLRSSRQRAIAVVRDEVVWALRAFFRDQGFRLVDTPILTPTSCEGTTSLFTTDYFGTPAYLSQSGQLYLEAAAMSLGKVYDFGPVFRAEKSKTRRHLTEFWMLDAEVAFNGHEENLLLQEKCLVAVAQHILKTCKQELALLGRDIKALEMVQEPFIRLRYTDAVQELHTLGSDMALGDDFGNDDETMLMTAHTAPVFVTHYPVAIKAFYMQPDPNDPAYALCNDLLLPEGYGEVMGGSERIHDIALLLKRIKDHKLKLEDFSWYVDLRKFGSVQHAGFGVGLERLVAYFCGLKHVRETIAFPRLLNRLRP